MASGLTRREAWAVPLGELLDLMAVYQIKYEGAKAVRSWDDEDVIPDVR